MGRPADGDTVGMMGLQQRPRSSGAFTPGTFAGARSHAVVSRLQPVSCMPKVFALPSATSVQKSQRSAAKYNVNSSQESAEVESFAEVWGVPSAFHSEATVAELSRLWQVFDPDHSGIIERAEAAALLDNWATYSAQNLGTHRDMTGWGFRSRGEVDLLLRDCAT